MAEITKGSTIRILPNLQEVMNQLGFDSATSRAFAARFSGTKQTAHAIWMDEDSGTTYVTVDLCREIPIQCCEPA